MDKEISTGEVISSLRFCRTIKDEFCKSCTFYVYGDDCIKHQNQAAADHLVSLAQLAEKQSEALEKLAAQLADSVKVVRCKDCKYWHRIVGADDIGWGICNRVLKGQGTTGPLNFCSSGAANACEVGGKA